MPMTVGEAMRQARLRAGLTLQQAAAQMDMDEATLSRYERDQLEAPLSVIARSAKVYRSSLPLLAYLERALRVFKEVAV